MSSLYRATTEDTFAVAQALRLRVANLPMHFKDTRLSDLDASVYRPDDWRTVEGFASGYHTTGGKGLLLAGPPGQGKSMIAAALLNEARARRRAWVRFQPLYTLIKMKQAQFSLSKQADWGTPGAREQYLRAENLIRRIGGETVGPEEPSFELVAVDDVGKENQSEFAARELDGLLRDRYNAGWPTIVTTNLKAEEWGERYHASTKSFLAEACYGLVIDTGQDQRLVRR